MTCLVLFSLAEEGDGGGTGEEPGGVVAEAGQLAVVVTLTRLYSTPGGWVPYLHCTYNVQVLQAPRAFWHGSGIVSVLALLS